MLHYNPRHVPSINMPIFRRANFIIKVSGIVTLCKWLYNMSDHETLPTDELKTSILLIIVTETEGTTDIQSLRVNGGFTALFHWCYSNTSLHKPRMKYPRWFDVFLTVHHSIDLFHLPTVMHNSFIH
jgi:hypothetical protein